jgi:hypothetical protein
MRDERSTGRDPIAKPTAWLDVPRHPGWYVCTRRDGPLTDLCLIRYQDGVCHTETGEPCGAPSAPAFTGARWIGPVERP